MDMQERLRRNLTQGQDSDESDGERKHHAHSLLTNVPEISDPHLPVSRNICDGRACKRALEFLEVHKPPQTPIPTTVLFSHLLRLHQCMRVGGTAAVYFSVSLAACLHAVFQVYL